MNTENLSNLIREMKKIISDEVHLKKLIDLFTSDAEIDEMLKYLKSNTKANRFDVNTEVHRITMKKFGIRI